MSSAIIGATAAVGTLAATGFSIYSSMQQGAAANRVAGMNADLMEKNAALQLRSDRLQIMGEIFDAQVADQSANVSLRVGQIDEGNARLQGLQNELSTATAVENATVAGRMSRIDASLARRDAATLKAYGRGVEAQSREKLARFRETGARMLAVTRAKIAKSGVVSEGSPLEVLADTAANIELGAQDIAYEAELTTRDIYRAADNKRQEASRSLLVGRMQLRSGRDALKSGRLARMGTEFAIAGSQLEQDSARLAIASAQWRQRAGKESLDIAEENYGLALEGAGIERASGAAQQRGATMAAIGTGINGVASAAGTVADNPQWVGNSIGTLQYWTNTVPKATPA